ncbi:MAG: cation transporting ATPase C-terminal domain-containing protein [Coprobacillaceae bacterium]
MWYGLIAAIISMSLYFYINMKNGWPNVPLADVDLVYQQATTMTLAAIVFCQVGAVLNCRTEKESIFKVGLFSNKKIILGIVFEILLLCALMYIPFLQSIFNTAPLSGLDWIILFLIPIPVIALEEIRKKMSNKKLRNTGEVR